MDNRAREVERLLQVHVSVPWTPARAEHVHHALVQRLQRRQVARRTTGAVSLIAIVATGVWWSLPATRATDTGANTKSHAGPVASRVVLDDGSILAAVEPGAEIWDLVESTGNASVWRLKRGAVSLNITGARGGVFRVHTNVMQVEVLAAVFVVEARGDQIQLSVQEHHVTASWPGGQQVVSAGQQVLLPPAPSEPAGADTATAPMRSRAEPSHGVRARGVQRWQRLAKRGQFDEAFGELAHALAVEGAQAIPDEPESVLLAADAARLSHHPEQALPHLRAFMRRFPRDPRASLAAFTMGLVLLEELGRPHEAAKAFAQSRRMSATGDLEEDALAREAEASFRAGDQDAAGRAAALYLQKYPQGRRAAAVRRFGALE